VQTTYFGAESGLVRDELWKKAHLSSRDSRRMDALGKVLGTKIQFAERVAEGKANAKYENGVITLALDAKDPVMTSVIHESIHRVKELSPETYTQLSEFVQRNMSKDMIESQLNHRRTLYQTSDRTAPTEELVADVFGVMLEDGRVLDRLVRENRTVAECVLDVARDILSSIQRAMHNQNLRLTQNQKYAFRELENRVAEMGEIFAQSLQRAGETEQISVFGDKQDIKFSKKDDC
jgi:hypothetical protein